MEYVYKGKKITSKQKHMMSCETPQRIDTDDIINII